MNKTQQLTTELLCTVLRVVHCAKEPVKKEAPGETPSSYFTRQALEQIGHLCPEGVPLSVTSKRPLEALVKGQLHEAVGEKKNVS